MRQRTKQLCYGMIYGMGVKSLAESLSISESEAQEFLETFMAAYPGIYKWLDDVLEEAHRDGYVTTLLGRRRHLPDLKSAKSSVRGELINHNVAVSVNHCILNKHSDEFRVSNLSASGTASRQHEGARLCSGCGQVSHDKDRAEDKMQLSRLGDDFPRDAN